MILEGAARKKRGFLMSKIDTKKRQKRVSLLDSAFSLFINNGFHKTSISDIVKDAGVAKGTFYLYFKDKYDIRNHLISQKANQVFRNAYDQLIAQEDLTDFEDQVLFIIDHILDQFAANHNLVVLLSKHLSWGFFKDSLLFTTDPDSPSVYALYDSLLSQSQYTYQSPELMMYLILELISGASYNAVLYEQPLPLNELKPHLYQTVKQILGQYRTEKTT